jgi:hypothetical protein
MIMPSFISPFHEVKFCGLPSCVFDKLGCAIGEKILWNTALQTSFLNGCGHGCACILFPFLRLILHRFEMCAPTLLALKWTVMC